MVQTMNKRLLLIYKKRYIFIITQKVYAIRRFCGKKKLFGNPTEFYIYLSLKRDTSINSTDLISNSSIEDKHVFIITNFSPKD